MLYLIIENFGGAEYASIVTDENGNNKVFNDVKEAQKEAENCQDGIAIEFN